MRALFTCIVGYGHLHPMVPLARALEAEGHEVAFATAEGFCPWVRRAGFRAFPAGLGVRDLQERSRRRFPTLSPDPGRRSLGDLFRVSVEVVAPAMVAGLVAVVREWAPDLLVHEPSDFGGPVVAALAGIPWVHHSWGPLLPLSEWRAAGAAAAPLWREWGLDPDDLGGMFRHLYLDLCPPRLQSREAQQLEARHLVRPVPFDGSAGEDPPAWLSSLPAPHTVYVTMGTMYNQDAGVFAAVLEGLRHEPVNLVVTVGNENDPAALGRQPDNVRVERYVPQSLVLPRCHAVVTHGGSGSTMGALWHGLPVLVLPQGADQFHNAEACAAYGAGRWIPRCGLSPCRVRRAVRALLKRPSYARAARRLRSEMWAMPGPRGAIGVLEGLVAASAGKGHPDKRKPSTPSRVPLPVPHGQVSGETTIGSQ